MSLNLKPTPRYEVDQMLALHDQGISYAEIARRLDKRPGTVRKIILSKRRQALKAKSWNENRHKRDIYYNHGDIPIQIHIGNQTFVVSCGDGIDISALNLKKGKPGGRRNASAQLEAKLQKSFRFKL